MLEGGDRRHRPAAGSPAVADLSPAERRVAELARAELTNREIAATLHISEKTVEAHLGRAYR